MLADLIGTGPEYRREILRYDMIRARAELSLTQTELASAAGVPKSVVSAYEKDSPPLYLTKNLVAVADALGIDLINDYGYQKRAPVNRPKGAKDQPRIHVYEHAHFGAMMRAMRDASRAGSQQKVSRLIGIAPGTIGAWETGAKLPSRKMLALWCEAVNQSPELWIEYLNKERERTKRQWQSISNQPQTLN